MKLDLGVIIGIVGILFGFLGSLFFYLKGKKNKKLVYNTETTVLISESLSNYENLKILYNNEDIKTLNSTNIKIKNIGNDIIETSDFVPAEPIIIKTSDHFLLQDVSKYNINSSNAKNRVHLTHIDESHIQVSFDFLNPKDEIQITVLHTGQISMTGDLKQGSVKNYSSKKYEKETDNFDKDFDIFYSAFGPKRIFSMLTILMSTLLATLTFLKMISPQTLEYFDFEKLLLPISTMFMTATVLLNSFQNHR